MWSGHLIKAELEEGKVLVQSNTSLQTISPEEVIVKGKQMSVHKIRKLGCIKDYQCRHRSFSIRMSYKYHFPNFEISGYHTSPIIN